MPTLVITGHPSAGKSTFARILAERALLLTDVISTVVLISEGTACPGRTKTECYETSAAEKVTREALKSTFDKYCTSSGGGGGGGGGGGVNDSASGGSGIVLHRNSTGGNSSTAQSSETRLVILDSLNYIKGFRYEIHCIAKASGQRHGVVWVLNDPDVCLEWNNGRRRTHTVKATEDWYRDDGLMRELMRRYEPPDQRNRWDKPLYRADVGSILANQNRDAAASANGNNNGGDNTGSADAVLSRTLYDMHCLTEAIGGGDAITTSEAVKATQKPASKSFKRSAAAGFKRNASRSTTAGRSAASSSGGGLAISRLTPEALESLDASNGRGVNAPPSMDGQGTDGVDDVIGPNDETNRNSTKKRQNTGKKEINDGTSAAPTSTEPRTVEELADSILNSFLGKNVSPLKEGKSTALMVNAGANVLHDVDVITQRVVAVLMAEQRTAAATGGAGTSGGKLRVPLGSGESQTTATIRTTRTVSLSELKRLRREYVKWSSSHPPEDTSEVGIATSFLTYVESRI